MTKNTTPTVYLFSNVTLGYGSPKYIYFLQTLEAQSYATATLEPFEPIRPAYVIEGLSSHRHIAGQRLLNNKWLRPLYGSFKFNKYGFMPLRRTLRNLYTLWVALLSYHRPLVVVTTYDNPLFGLFSRSTLLIQNFSEIWPTPRYGMLQRLLHRYRDNVDICISPQEDRLNLARTRYPQAKHFLVHNAPRLGKPAPQRLPQHTIHVLYQGRFGTDNYPHEMVALLQHLAAHIHIHIAGIIEDSFLQPLQQLAEQKDHITLHGYLPAPALDQLRNQCSVGIIAWDNQTENARFAAPNKLYEHLHNGDLVLFFPNYALHKLNQTFEFGIETTTGVEMAHFLNQLDWSTINQIGDNNYQTYQHTLNFEHQIAPVIAEIEAKIKG